MNNEASWLSQNNNPTQKVVSMDYKIAELLIWLIFIWGLFRLLFWREAISRDTQVKSKALAAAHTQPHHWSKVWASRKRSWALSKFLRSESCCWAKLRRRCMLFSTSWSFTEPISLNRVNSSVRPMRRMLTEAMLLVTIIKKPRPVIPAVTI